MLSHTYENWIIARLQGNGGLAQSPTVSLSNCGSAFKPTVLPRSHRSALLPYPLSTWHHRHICRPNRVLVTQTSHKISRAPSLWLCHNCFLSGSFSFPFVLPSICVLLSRFWRFPCCIIICNNAVLLQLSVPSNVAVHLSRQETAIKLNDPWVRP